MLSLVLSLVFLVLLGVLLVMGGNYTEVPLNLLFLRWEKVPLFILVFFTFFSGILLHYLLVLPSRVIHWWRHRQKQNLEKVVSEQQEEIRRLREELDQYRGGQ